MNVSHYNYEHHYYYYYHCSPFKKILQPLENQCPSEPHGGMIKIIPYWIVLHLLIY